MNSTLYTRRSETRRRLGLIIGFVVVSMGVWGGATALLERLATSAEVTEGYYLWGEEEWLDVLKPARYVSAQQSILLTGASEAREAFLVEKFENTFENATVIQNAQSLGNLRSVTLQLEYIQRVHGADAFPRLVVLGLSPRVVFNDPGLAETPLFQAINLYSAEMWVEDVPQGFRVHDRRWTEGIAPRARFAGKQSVRYKNALRAVALQLATRYRPDAAQFSGFKGRLDPYKYQHLEPIRDRDYWGEFRTMEPVAYDLSPSGVEFVQADAHRLRAVLREMQSQLVIVVLPEAPWLRSTYPRRFHRDFVTLLRRTYLDVPILDLTYELTADHYYDYNHVTRYGAEITTTRTIDFIHSLDEVGS